MVNSRGKNIPVNSDGHSVKIKKKYSLFSYKSGSSFLHKCSSWIKLTVIPAVSIALLLIPVQFSIGLAVVQFVLALAAGLTIREQLTDQKPVLFYAVMLFFMQLLLAVGENGAANLFTQFNWENQKENVFLLIKLFCIMQSTSLLFKTTTSLELREGIAVIEKCVRRPFSLKHAPKTDTAFTDAISLFLNFIPIVAQIWEQSKKAWLARGGKKSIKMYCVLLPVLFSVGMKKAWNQSRALYIRQS